MANNYNFHAQTTQDGGGASEHRYNSLAQLQREQQQQPQTQPQQLQLQQLQQPQPQPQTLQQPQQLQQQQYQVAIQNNIPASNETDNYFHQPPYTTNIAVQGQKIKSKLNPMAQEFYPSYMRNPKNGYTTYQVPNAAAVAAAATASQYTTLDYDYNDWPTYDYDFARYMDYERFMTGHIQRSNTALPLVRYSCSGSGSAAAASRSTSFHDQPSFEHIRKSGSFNRSYSSASYNYRKNQASREVSKENMRSWYIDKKAEEKRMESWKNVGGDSGTYQDAIPATSSKEEYFETQSPPSDLKPQEAEEVVEEKKEVAISQELKQVKIPRVEGGATERLSRKFAKTPKKPKKENLEWTKKKLIMLYPSKKIVNESTQSSQESMFTQPNPIEYTSDESFLTQLSSSAILYDAADQNAGEAQKEEGENIGKESHKTETENTDSLEDFELTTKTSDQKILNSSESVSPISVIEQEKPCKLEKSIRPVEVKANNKKHEHEKGSVHKSTAQSKIKSAKSKLCEKEIINKEIEIKVHKPTQGPKEVKPAAMPKSKFFTNTSEVVKEEHKHSTKPNRTSSTAADTEHSPVTKTQRTAGGTVIPKIAYTGAVPKSKEPSSNLTLTRSREPTSSSQGISKPISKTGAIPKIRDSNTSSTRKSTANVEETVTKSVRGTQPPKTSSPKDEKQKLEHLIQRPPNGIVSNRIHIVGNSTKGHHVVSNSKAEVRSLERTEVLHKRHSVNSEGHGTKNAGHGSPRHPNKPPTPISILKKAAAQPVVVIQKRSVPKSIVKTQMRSATNLRGSSPSKKSNDSQSKVIKKDVESKKVKSAVVSSRTVQPSSSKSSKTGSTKIPIREKSSSLRGVKAVIGSDGDNIAKVKSSKSCISLRVGGRKVLNKKPSITNTKIMDKKSSANKNKNSTSREAVTTNLRHTNTEKRRNQLSDPSPDYKIIQSSILNK